jgi:hypothetical protein
MSEDEGMSRFEHDMRAAMHSSRALEQEMQFGERRMGESSRGFPSNNNKRKAEEAGLHYPTPAPPSNPASASGVSGLGLTLMGLRDFGGDTGSYSERVETSLFTTMSEDLAILSTPRQNTTPDAALEKAFAARRLEGQLCDPQNHPPILHFLSNESLETTNHFSENDVRLLRSVAERDAVTRQAIQGNTRLAKAMGLPPQLSSGRLGESARDDAYELPLRLSGKGRGGR